MSAQQLFGITILMSLVAWSVVLGRYVWPALRGRTPADALRPILMLHSFRFVGLAFLVPGVVSPRLPDAFAHPAAYGDFVTSLLALLALATLHRKLGIVLAWVVNLVGPVDLLNAYYQGNRTGVGLEPGLQGAMYFVPAVVVPLLLLTHGIALRILIRAPGGKSPVEPSADRASIDRQATAGSGPATGPQPLGVSGERCVSAA